LISEPTHLRTQPRNRRYIPFAALFLAIAAACSLFALRHAGQWLEVDEPLQHSRAIAILGGGQPFRPIEAANLYRAGWAREVWLTQGAGDEKEAALEKIGIPVTPEHELSRQILLKLGVPPAAIQVVPGTVNNTAAELAAILRYAQAGSHEPVILATSRSHTRRVRVIWDILSDDRYPAIVRYTELDPYNAVRWWQTSTDAMTTAHEVFGIVNARAGFPIAPRER
jgi:uncharacterized SAM-binding protein YcdF (DUF218 family)